MKSKAFCFKKMKTRSQECIQFRPVDVKDGFMKEGTKLDFTYCVSIVAMYRLFSKHFILYLLSIKP